MKIKFKPNVKTALSNVDPLHIRMVIENLLNNANKYSPEGSTVNVTLSSSPNYQVINIEDRGIGIATEDMSKLFQKFSRVQNPESNASGSGLGLYWAKKLVDLHNGTIDVSSKPGKGTTFTVKLPRVKTI